MLDLFQLYVSKVASRVVAGAEVLRKVLLVRNASAELGVLRQVGTNGLFETSLARLVHADSQVVVVDRLVSSGADVIEEFSGGPVLPLMARAATRSLRY